MGDFEGKACKGKVLAEQSAAQAAVSFIKKEKGIKTKQPKGQQWSAKKAKKAPRQPTGPLVRTAVSSKRLSGEVLFWRAKSGWIKPSTVIDHPQVKKHGGKIYIHQDDLKNGAAPLNKGAAVSFTLYSDESGLGAENVMI